MPSQGCCLNLLFRKEHSEGGLSQSPPPPFPGAWDLAMLQTEAAAHLSNKAIPCCGVCKVQCFLCVRVHSDCNTPFWLLWLQPMAGPSRSWLDADAQGLLLLRSGLFCNKLRCDIFTCDCCTEQSILRAPGLNFLRLAFLGNCTSMNDIMVFGSLW